MAGEEPEFSIRCLATKHSWRGRYRRIFCVTASSLVTLDPSNLASTNCYDLLSEFESLSVSPPTSRDDPQVSCPRLAQRQICSRRVGIPSWRASCAVRTGLPISRDDSQVSLGSTPLVTHISSRNLCGS